GDRTVIAKLMPLLSRRRPGIKFAMVILALALVIFAASRPQFGSKLKEVKTEGVEIVIALDVSNSMLAEDIKPNRLEAAKRAIGRMLENLDNDKIGLIVFAGSAYTQVPVTTDYTATKMLLSTLSTNVVQEQGTAIGDAIRLAMKSFSPKNEEKKALVIITDGENHEDNPIQAAEEAKEKGIVIYTIGLGDTKGTPIPIPGSSDFRRDRDGKVIMTSLNENMLIDIANATDGKYIRANNTRIGLAALYDEIEKLDKTELESVVYAEYEDVYQYVIFLALLILLFDFVILNRKNKQLEKIKIFNLRS
ncbi:MAG: VWA domain-containing protein, partial [Bacteroidales bacterium]|nr:VWA domain-containing protein [Bacteroidales bacterium]